MRETGTERVTGRREQRAYGWEVFIPCPDEWINLNQRMHWAPKAKRTRAWRDAGHVHARAAGLPKGLERVQITAHVVKSTARAYDAHNLIPTVKALIDGLVDYGLVPDDTNAFVVGPDMRCGGKGTPGIRLEIREVGTRCGIIEAGPEVLVTPPGP